MPRARPSHDVWQSFADLGMALMGVMLLIAVVLLQRQKTEAQERIKEADKRAEEREAEAEGLRTFALGLLKSLENARALETRPEHVNEWIAELFETPGCELSFDPESGKLTATSGLGQLYDAGQTRLSDEATQQLEGCRDVFLTLAACLGPSDTGGGRPEGCAENADVAKAFAQGVEALVLQGNTDRTPFPARRIEGLRGSRPTEFSQDFVGNAQLGAERARQALGHLMVLIEAGSETSDDRGAPIQAFASKARIESPSFGLYQAGPRGQESECPSDDACDAARNLSLKLQFRRETLVEPFREVTGAFCEEWGKDGSQLRTSMKADERKRGDELCASYAEETRTASAAESDRTPPTSPSESCEGTECNP